MTKFDEGEWHEINHDPDTNERIVRNHIAKTFVRLHGDFAVMRAMEEMMSDNSERKHLVKHWRLVIEEIERIQNDKGD